MASSLNTLIPILFTVYVISVAVFIILENRSPQSTFAWLLLLILLPIGGVIIYLFFGRSWHAFSRETKLARQAVGGGGLTDSLSPLFQRQEAIVARIAAERPASYNRKLLQLLASNSNRGSLLTEFNEAEVLQDAAAKYPRLLEDLRDAQDSIHLEYDIMAAEKHIYIQSPFFIPDDSISEALRAAALAGVDVRMMFQPRGGSYQINAVVYDEAIAGSLADDFHRDLQQCREFELQAYQQQPVLSRLTDSVYRLASPLL